MAGFSIVRECMENSTVLGFMNKMLYDEVIPTLPLDKDDLMNFAQAVQDRFYNPFVNHELMSISLNSTSKWRARCFPSFAEYVQEYGKLPACLTTSFAAYIAFYSNNIQELTDAGLVCKDPQGRTYTISDDRWVLEFYYDHKDDDAAAGEDLTKIEGFEAEVTRILEEIRKDGVLKAYAACL